MAERTRLPRMDSLVALRTARGMSQRELSAALGRSPATVAQWERGYCFPTTDNLLALANLFNCSVDEVLGRAPPERAG